MTLIRLLSGGGIVSSGVSELNSSITIDTIQNVLSGTVFIVSSAFFLSLDTTPPQNVSVSIDGGVSYSKRALVTCTLNTADVNTTGYKFKIWGHVDGSYDPAIQATENGSNWKLYSSSVPIRLDSAQGTRTIYLKIMDDVGNISAEVTASIILDTIIPIATVMSAPQAPKLSRISGYNYVSFTWQGNEDFIEYALKLVPNPNSVYEEGILIPDTFGSLNISNTGSFVAEQNITSRIYTDDLKLVAEDGVVTIKVFTRDLAGNWSD
jgi:hypothetical protein